jgi:3-deoxy-manno-octulosonate cytidylyltransferase (CMP-KDO synthetase)
MKVAAVIPCRYGSTRFPGKPLADIGGKPMLWHVYKRAASCWQVDTTLIATDDARIAQVCRDLDIPVAMTRSHHLTGTDRVAECAERLDADIVVNVQGDEPMIETDAITEVVDAVLMAPPGIAAANAYTPFVGMGSDVVDTNNVKAVLAADGTALYFSRQPVPYPKGGAVQFLRQLGLYAFRREGLALFASLAPGPAELAEGVEMLRLVEHGHRVRMVQVVDSSIPVDTPADLDRVRKMMARR